MARKPFFRTMVMALLYAAASAAPSAGHAATRSDFAVRSVWQFDQAFETGDYMWDDAGAKSGAIRIVVDLDAEMLYVYRGGVEIGRSTILYGYDEKPTPTGVFPIIAKYADHYSSIYGGAPMPHTLRLTRGGVAIHGSEVEAGYATHGCVGIPKPFAAALFAAVRVGDPVLITRGWLTREYGQPRAPAYTRQQAGYEQGDSEEAVQEDEATQ
ncbi:MAG TPA: L,D-transpeptidase family protein [Allosphingosinicella sp.]|nr:L,D-transpeptidase family protein [Allosphingosinicella sp.]